MRNLIGGLIVEAFPKSLNWADLIDAATPNRIKWGDLIEETFANGLNRRDLIGAIQLAMISAET